MGTAPIHQLKPHWDDKLLAQVVRETDDWLVAVIPMIYNDRVILVSRAEYDATPYPCWVAGWCYPKGAAAVLAAMAWDPDTQHSPTGFKKVAGDTRE